MNDVRRWSGAERPRRRRSSSGCARASRRSRASWSRCRRAPTRAVAAAQERAYWLERWHVDLNALMRSPGAREFRALLRAVRGRGARSDASSSGACRTMTHRLGRRPRQGRRALPGGAARRARPRGARRGAGDRLGLDATARSRSPAPPASRVVEIEPGEFAPRPHPQPRRASVTSGELICFLTQDATPCPGWLDAYREAFALDAARRRRLRPAPAAPGHEPDDRARADRVLRHASRPTAAAPSSAPATPTFLSNVNACYARACWEEIALPRRRLRRGPGVRRATCSPPAGPRSTTPAPPSCTRTTTARSSSCAATSTSTAGCARRPATSSRCACAARSRLVGADLRWMARARASAPAERAALDRALARPPRRPADRRAGSARAPRSLPGPLSRAALARGPRRRAPSRAATAAPSTAAAARQAASRRGAGARRTTPRRRSCARTAPCRCSTRCPGMSERERLRIAMLLPPFRRGSGGHNTLLQILIAARAARPRLQRLGPRRACGCTSPSGPACCAGTCASSSRRSRRRSTRASTPGRAPTSRSRPAGRRCYPALLLDQLPRPRLRRQRPRARLLRRPRSSARSPSDTYRQGLHCIAASPWLRDLLVDRYGASADAFQLGVEHDAYQPRPIARRDDTVDLLRAPRDAAPRRADRPRGAARAPRAPAADADRPVRRPDTRSRRRSPTSTSACCTPDAAVVAVLAGDGRPVPVDDELLADAEGDARLRAAVRRARRRQRRVDLRRPTGRSSWRSSTRPRSPTRSSACSTTAPLRERRSREGIEFVASHTWEHATDEVEAGLRHALRLREEAWVFALAAPAPSGDGQRLASRPKATDAVAIAERLLVQRPAPRRRRRGSPRRRAAFRGSGS